MADDMQIEREVPGFVPETVEQWQPEDTGDMVVSAGGDSTGGGGRGGRPPRKSAYRARIQFVDFDFPPSLHVYALGWAARHPEIPLESGEVVVTGSLSPSQLIQYYVLDVCGRDMMADEDRDPDDQQYDFGAYFYAALPAMVRTAMVADAQIDHARALADQKTEIAARLHHAMKRGPVTPEMVADALNLGGEPDA